MFTTLETERLLIRRFRDDDLADLVALRSDPTVARYMTYATFDEVAASSGRPTG
ncbi:MAG: GNAT family N-acetyltransferase [Deltaproteobacteria bacterium]|nr:GNAT family N-acetyltransferase [Deltaproteobacteria bacterium]